MALDPEKKQEQPYAYELGQAAGDSMRAAAGLMARPQLAAELTGVPGALRRASDIGANFGRGVTGQPAPVAPAPTPQVNVISPTRPDFGNVRPPAPKPAPTNVRASVTPAAPKAPARPAAPPAQDPAATAAGGGGSAPTGRVLGTFTGRNGTQTLTESDAAAVAGRLPTASGPVVMGPNGSYAAGTGGGPELMDTAASMPALQRPTFGGGAQGAVIGMPGTGPDAERAALLSALNDRLRSIGTPNTRGKRDLLANVLKLQSDLTAQGGDLATRRDLGQLEANTRTNVAQMGETGANYRAELGDTGATQRTLIGERGSNARAELAQAGENYRLLNRPEYAAGTDGTYNMVQGGVARPVTGADGQPFKPAGKDNGGLTAANVIDAYDKARKAIVDTTPVGQAPDFSTLDASPAGQAYASLFAGNSAGGRAASGPRPTQEEFMAKARAANPGVSDAQLADYYKRNYGQ